MKKFLSLILVVSLALGAFLFTSCEKSPEELAYETIEAKWETIMAGGVVVENIWLCDTFEEVDGGALVNKETINAFLALCKELALAPEKVGTPKELQGQWYAEERAAYITLEGGELFWLRLCDEGYAVFEITQDSNQYFGYCPISAENYAKFDTYFNMTGAQ